MPNRPDINHHVLRYMLLRIRAGLDHLLDARSELLPRPPESLRAQYVPVSDRLTKLATRVGLDEWELWRNAFRFGLTDQMLELKRETLDLTLGRRAASVQFRKELEKAAKRGDVENFFEPERIFVNPRDRRGVDPMAFCDFAEDLLSSVSKLDELDAACEFVKEFV
ncbi:MAG: hypothetical protein WCA98_06915, partial [Candidatus Acidiferrales bacterium]